MTYHAREMAIFVHKFGFIILKIPLHRGLDCSANALSLYGVLLKIMMPHSNSLVHQINTSSVILAYPWYTIVDINVTIMAGITRLAVTSVVH